MPHVKANGIDIWYEVHNDGAGGTPLVLTHGFAGPSRQWIPELAPLWEDRPLITYDVRGHDRTTVPPDVESYSMPAFAADLAALLREIGVEKAHVGGVSMGGMVTAQFAVDFPETCASVLIIDSTCGNAADTGPGGDWERRLQQGIGALAHMVQKYGLKETLLREWEWKKENDPHLDVSPYALEDDLYRISLMTVEGYVGAAHAILTRPDLLGRIPGITVPTLVMCGEWDDFLPCAMRDAKLIPNASLVVRERCGHGSKWQVETFVSEINRFLAAVDAGRPVAAESRI
jgi:pimeloyl-ACP methyl ester carboxylesterase